MPDSMTVSSTIRELVPILGVLTTLTACGGGYSDTDEAAIPYHTDVLTHEFTINSWDLPEEYQLVNPTDLTVDAAGNVFICDDERIKVFDSTGRPLRIIGGPGQGPGEFQYSRTLAVGPQDHLAVQETWTSTIFETDGNLMHEIQYRAVPVIREYLRNAGITFSTLYRVIPLNPDSLLMELKARNYTLNSIYCGIEPLLLLTPGGLEELAYYHSRNHVRPVDGGEFSLDFQGQLLWTLAGTDLLVFTETGLERDRSTDPLRYHLNILRLTTMVRDTLTIPYEPIYIPEEARLMDYGIERPGDLRLRLSDDALAMLRDTNYYPTLKQIYADGHRLYGFAYCERDTAAWLSSLIQNAGPRRVDFIDLNNRQLTARADFPFLPDAVRNGRAYRIVAPADDLARIEIHAIDERVWNPGR
jgi:hypothetical protein